MHNNKHCLTDPVEYIGLLFEKPFFVCSILYFSLGVENIRISRAVRNQVILGLQIMQSASLRNHQIPEQLQLYKSVGRGD